MSSVLVLALNPCVDAEWRVDGLRPDEKNTLLAERQWAGGKGVNVARWLLHLKVRSRLAIIVGGKTGEGIFRQLRDWKILTKPIQVAAPTRINTLITAPDGAQMRFNGLGPKLNAREWGACLALVRKELSQASWLVLSGSLPQGVSSGAYAQLIRIAARQGVRSVLDCDGSALDHAVRARPFLIKPNVEELSQWAGHKLATNRAVQEAAGAISRITRGWVLVSRGKAGALLVNAESGFCRFACAPQVRAVNTLGAGDALLAAVVRTVVKGLPPEDWLREGVATGTATAIQPAGVLPPLATVRRFRRHTVLAE